MDLLTHTFSNPLLSTFHTLRKSSNHQLGRFWRLAKLALAFHQAYLQFREDDIHQTLVPYQSILARFGAQPPGSLDPRRKMYEQLQDQCDPLTV